MKRNITLPPAAASGALEELFAEFRRASRGSALRPEWRRWGR